MNYNEFIIKYPWMDLALELFKGIIPTLMALLAIIINNKRAKRRDIEKTINDMKIKAYLEIQSRVVEISDLIFVTGQYFWNSMISQSEEDDLKEFTKFVSSKELLVSMARKTIHYAKMECVSNEIIELSFENCFSAIGEYVESLNVILREAMAKESNSKNKQIKKDTLDWVQGELAFVSEKVEKEIYIYIYSIAKLRKKMIDNSK